MQRAVVDGVLVVHGPWAGARRDEEVTAGLVLATGRRDEPYPLLGVTGLLAAAATRGLEHETGQQADVQLDASSTWLAVHGPPVQVHGWLSRAAQLLLDPPAGPLPELTRLVADNDTGLVVPAVGLLLRRRYGLRDVGLLGLSPPQPRRLGVDHLRWWASQRARTGGVVAFTTADDVDGLRLPFPPGGLPPCPEPRQVSGPLPGWDDWAGGVAVGGTTRHRDGLSLALSYVAQREDLERTFLADPPVEGAGVHLLDDVGADGLVHGALHGRVRGGAHRAGAAAGWAYEQLARLAADDLPGATVEAVQEICERTVSSHDGDDHEAPSTALAAASRAAQDLARGRAPAHARAEVPADRYVALLRDPDRALSEAQAAARDVLADALVLAPEAVQVRMPRYTYPPTAPGPLPGRPRHARTGDRGRFLVVGDAGVSRTGPAASLAVRAPELVALQRVRDGVAAVSADGTVLEVDPELWDDGPGAVAELLARVPPHLHVVP